MSEQVAMRWALRRQLPATREVQRRNWVTGKVEWERIPDTQRDAAIMLQARAEANLFRSWRERLFGRMLTCRDCGAQHRFRAHPEFEPPRVGATCPKTDSAHWWQTAKQYAEHDGHGIRADGSFSDARATDPA